MYSLNLTGRKTLITPAEILLKTNSNQNLDSGKLLPNIEIAEVRFLKGELSLGSGFYTELGEEKNRLVTAGNINTLQQLFDAQHAGPDDGEAPQLVIGDVVNAAEFLSAPNLDLWVNGGLWKYAAECCLYVSFARGYVDITSQGLQKNNPIGSVVDPGSRTTVGASLADLKYLKETWVKEILEPLRMDLSNSLIDNPSFYPTWNSWYRGRNSEGGSPTAASSYVDLSIYADEDEYRGGCVYRGNDPGRKNCGPSRNA